MSKAFSPEPAPGEHPNSGRPRTTLGISADATHPAAHLLSEVDMAAKRQSELSLASQLQQLAKALEDARNAHKQLEAAHERAMAIANRALRMAASRGSTRPTKSLKADSQLLKMQLAMQRQSTVFTSVSNVLKTRH